MIPATSDDAPNARAVSRASLVPLSSQRDATTTATKATAPYTTAVTMTVTFCVPKSEPRNAYRIRQLRLKPELSAAPKIDA
ncbi:hypothetical protein MYIN104542_29230 [Mycobacterium intermedium]